MSGRGPTVLHHMRLALCLHSPQPASPLPRSVADLPLPFSSCLSVCLPGSWGRYHGGRRPSSDDSFSQSNRHSTILKLVARGFLRVLRFPPLLHRFNGSANKIKLKKKKKNAISTLSNSIAELSLRTKWHVT